MIKINQEEFEKFNTIKFLLESIQDETIILGERVSIPLEQKKIITCEQIDSFRSLLNSTISCKKIMHRDGMRDFFGALHCMCFILKYHPKSLDKKLSYNGMFFHEGIYKGFISFDYDFFKPVKERNSGIKPERLRSAE
jgi:hypothetical protein